MLSTAIRRGANSGSRSITLLLRQDAPITATACSSTTRGYISRAHPTTIPEFPVPAALDMVLQGIEERKVKRLEKWEKNSAARQSKGLKVRRMKIQKALSWM